VTGREGEGFGGAVGWGNADANKEGGDPCGIWMGSLGFLPLDSEAGGGGGGLGFGAFGIVEEGAEF